MTTRVTLEPAFILHNRPFQDSSLLIDLFTLNYGRVTIIGKGVRGPRSKTRGLLQPFVPLLVSWSGKPELPTMSKVEPNGNNIYCLSGNNLASGFYLNELLSRLLQKRDPHPEIYQIYTKTIASLQTARQETISSTLRIFEKHLAKHLGYGLQLNMDCTGANIEPEAQYMFKFEMGFLKLTDKIALADITVSGKTLVALNQEAFTTSKQLHEAKILLKQILAPLLGNRPIKSRELWFNE